MIAFCRDAGFPFDFVSTRQYPTDDPLWRNNHLTIEEFFKQFAHEMGKYERGVVREMTARASAQACDLPLYYTEWNTSGMVPDTVHDEAYSATLVAKTIADNDGLVDSYSFWIFSDLFEEMGQYGTPFHGGFGLQTIYGTPKPTYRLFEMLHHLGDIRIPIVGGKESTVEMLAVRRNDNLTLLVYNHNIPGAEIATENVSITLKGIMPDKPATLTRIDQGSANPKKKWIDLGIPEYPTRAQLSEIELASLPVTQVLASTPVADGCILEFSIPAHGTASITLNLMSA